MIKNDYIVRVVRKDEYETTENLVRESFWNVYRPGCLEHYVLNQMRKAPDYIPDLDFVIEKEGRMIGQNIFVPAEIALPDKNRLPVMSMGPISVLPAYRNSGAGRFLLEESLKMALQYGVPAVFIEGDISFYGRSGFVLVADFGITYHGLPADADTSFFLCRVLKEGFLRGISGEYSTPQVYFVEQTRREKFDMKFPYKEKLVLPGQIF